MQVPEQLPDPVAVAVEVTGVLERLEIAYVVGGSLASAVHGEPRSTLDVDVVVDLAPELSDRLVASLRERYYVDAEGAEQAARTGGSFNAIHVASSVKVDFFVVHGDPFDLERLKHRLRVQVGDATSAAFYVDTAEHSLLRKLEWYRRGGEVSDRQWRDVRAIVAVQGDRLDRQRLTKWAAHLGVSDLLERLLQ